MATDLAVDAASVTMAGSANTAFAGSDMASSCPFRSKIVPRVAGSGMSRIRWSSAMVSYADASLTCSTTRRARMPDNPRAITTNNVTSRWAGGLGWGRFVEVLTAIRPRGST